MENLAETAFENAWEEIQRNRPVPENISKEEAQYIRDVNEINKHRYYFDDLGNYCFDGFYAGEYLLTAFRYGKKTFFGEQFDEIVVNMKGMETDDVYDIVMINEHTAGMVELKYEVRENNLPAIIRKAETFRINFPYYNDFKIYLGLASLSFYPELEEACIEHGIAIIKQAGETVVINDEHIKAY